MKRKVLLGIGLILYILFLLSLYENIQTYFELIWKNIFVFILNLIIGFKLFYIPFKNYIKERF
jgi:hypothetical protein